MLHGFSLPFNPVVWQIMRLDSKRSQQAPATNISAPQGSSRLPKALQGESTNAACDKSPAPQADGGHPDRHGALRHKADEARRPLSCRASWRDQKTGGRPKTGLEKPRPPAANGTCGSAKDDTRRLLELSAWD